MINGKSVSLCMVVYNSSDLVENAIKSVKSIVDEIVIVDQGSTPEESAKLKLLANMYYKTTNKGNGDYDRQYCYALATKEYILALDADEAFDEEELARFPQIMQYNFDVCWFLFKNFVYFNTNTEVGEVKVDIKEILGGDDPHPRFWKRRINMQGRDMSPVQWPHTAHQFPQIVTQNQLFSDMKVNHTRSLTNIVKTHLHRKKNIDRSNQQLEKNFVTAVLQKFDKKIVIDVNKLFPELKSYLKD